MWVICGSVAGLRECQKWSESPKGHCRCCWPRHGWETLRKNSWSETLRSSKCVALSFSNIRLDGIEVRTMRQLFTATLRGLAFYEGGVGLVEDGVIEGGRATWYGVQIVVLGFPRIFDKETDSEFSSSPHVFWGNFRLSQKKATGLLRPLVPSPSCWWPQVVHQPFRQR